MHAAAAAAAAAAAGFPQKADAAFDPASAAINQIADRSCGELVALPWQSVSRSAIERPWQLLTGGRSTSTTPGVFRDLRDALVSRVVEIDGSLTVEPAQSVGRRRTDSGDVAEADRVALLVSSNGRRTARRSDGASWTRSRRQRDVSRHNPM
jgi:hypothetical protein